MVRSSPGTRLHNPKSIRESKQSKRGIRKAPEPTDNRNEYEVFRLPPPEAKPKNKQQLIGIPKLIFPKLPNAKVSAIILSYTRYEDQINALLNLLSTNSKLFASAHYDKLKGRLVKWRPRVATAIEFGHKGSKMDSLYPSKRQIREFPFDKRIRLCAIRYKCIKKEDMETTLSGIEFTFTNNIKTPMFDTKGSGMDEMKTLQVDPTRQITRIDMKVWSDEIYGLRLVEKPGKYVLNEMWNTKNPNIGRWESFRIPD